MAYIEFDGVKKQYEASNEYSVSNFNLEIAKGEFIVFVGPSGCGKSTTLRMIAGLEEITEGEISIDGKIVNDLHPRDRNLAMVFQNYALYPHMTVGDNIGFGLKMAKTPKKEIEEKVNWAAQMLGLSDYLKRKPKDLSGGQRQRVALGRAIVRNPKVFLMDEPLSNLDANLRATMRNEIIKIHRELQATTIYVTHDQVEAMTMADRIVVLKDGLIQQIGSPMELYEHPQNMFVANFISSPAINLFAVSLVDEQLIFADGSRILIDGELITKLQDKKEFVLGIRPEHMTIDPEILRLHPQQVMELEIVNLERMGSENQVHLQLDTTDLVLKAPSLMSETIGDQLKFMLDIQHAHFFDKESGNRLF